VVLLDKAEVVIETRQVFRSVGVREKDSSCAGEFVYLKFAAGGLILSANDD
jgi:hypothetical protein